MSSLSEIVKPYTILVVDDEEHILKFIGIMLRTSGYQVLTAPNGLRALEIIKSGIIDLVVTDLMMPQLDGVLLIKQIRAFSKVPIIVLSGTESEQNKLDALENGASDYFHKPFDLKKLMDCIRARLPVGSS